MIGALFFLIAAWGARADDGPSKSDSDAGSVAEGEKWFLRVPPDGRVVYRGVVSFDGAGMGPGAMVYSAPNLGGFVAALITHGLINESIKQGQKDKLQSNADKVLTRYRLVLESFSLENLMQRALLVTASGADVSLLQGAAEDGGRMGVESYPVFSLTQDQTAIILDNAIVIHSRDTTRESVYKNTVRIISKPSNQTDPAEFWTANNGENLKVESARLVAESFDIAFLDRTSTTEPEGEIFKTVRYREGSAEKFERAKVLVNRCDRMVIRSLRGTLMSVPISGAARLASAESSCTP